MSWKFGKKISGVFGLAIDALETISQLTASATDDTAVGILRAVSSVVETLKAGFEGKISIEACENAIADLRSHLKSSDILVDAALRDRFPNG